MLDLVVMPVDRRFVFALGILPKLKIAVASFQWRFAMSANHVACSHLIPSLYSVYAIITRMISPNPRALHVVTSDVMSLIMFEHLLHSKVKWSLIRASLCIHHHHLPAGKSLQSSSSSLPTIHYLTIIPAVIYSW